MELWPRPHERRTHLATLELFKDKKHEHKTITRALNLLAAQELLGRGQSPWLFRPADIDAAREQELG